MASGWFDFDDDGWLDLYAVSDAPPMQNWLMWNQQGSFATSVGTGLEFIVAGMGLAAGDLNNDDVVDIMVTGINELPTLVSFPESGIWIESALAWNLTNQKPLKAEVAWGGEFADLDNDGFLEMIETYGGLFGSSYAHAQPDEIHLNQGDNTFVHVGADWGWDDLDVNRGFVIADLNDDGWLDTVKRELGGVVFVDIANCGEAAWLKIRLRDEGRHNHHAIGARVTIEAAGHRQTRWVTAGSTSYCSADVPEVHFGLGDADIVDKIEVLWPTGELVTYPAHHTRQILEIRPE